MTIETKKASYKDAGEMLKGYAFNFSNENYSDDYKVTRRFFDGTNELGANCFAMIEYVEDGLLRKVRFINTYRETAIDIEISNAAEVNSEETAEVTADAKEENTMTNAIKMTIAKNGAKMYYVDGKRISRDKAIEISKNADNEMLTNALGANIELKDAQAILIIETKDPLEVGKYREFGWFFANVDDAVNAAKKVAALFGDRFTGARIMGDAEHFDNRTIATVDKAGNVEIKKQIPTYIFTTYQTVTGVNCNGRTEHTDTFATYCKEIGDDDNFTGLYREVTFFDENRLSGWSIKTADGTIIAKGNTEAELKKAYEAIKAGNVEVSEEIADKTVTFYPTDTPKPCTGKLFGYDVCEYHSVEEYISELKITQIAVIMENLFKNEDGSFSYDGWGRKTYYMTDCYREAYYGGGYYNEITLDAESTTQLIYVEQQLKNIVNGSDGSEEDIDGDNVFDYLPALDELNDVDIDDDDNTPPDSEPMSDDISDICKYNPDLEDDDKSCRLDWDDSAIAHIPTGEEELAAFINPQIVIEEGYLEPADKIAAAKPKHSRRQLRDLIDSNLAEINHYLDGLDECSADENCPQSHIDFLHDKIKNLGKKYRQYYREYREAPAEEIAG